MSNMPNGNLLLKLHFFRAVHNVMIENVKKIGVQSRFYLYQHSGLNRVFGGQHKVWYFSEAEK